jgi:hypothetical protein
MKLFSDISYHVRSAAAIVLAVIAMVGIASAQFAWFIALPLIGAAACLGWVFGLI